jgi:mRNA-degrading endonuclease RelE of RelBE toxin-antitoxin system
MHLHYTDRFRRAYRALTVEGRRRVQNALHRLAENPRHPGLHVKKLQGAGGIWEARASRSLRITFEIQDDVLILRNVGYHDATLKQP